MRTDLDRNPRIELQDGGSTPHGASCKVVQVCADGTVQADVKQNRSCLEQTVRRNLAQLDDVAQGKLGEVGITTAEQIAWRARH